MITDEFNIDEADMLRDVQIEDESRCNIRAGINHGANLGNYLFEKINAISYNELKEILTDSKVGNILSSKEIDEVTAKIQEKILAPRLE
ncbi:hypothetical protein PseudUWO311_09200 [Pseudanabaena sp. UWO311]|uniref:hypothetical protein n=1 Tax=Pseudanabaena sp. UWO311 TaxID=2487337 RepID=UPI001159FCAB|nr:hypothetical protein [Pseudanabaena sp. UWO311]TYQ27167.1 hypothetical protein PseudUWO311_09200 [Pseudanabaena sp. UWO311]